jgi:hypothetical protein
MKKGDVVMFIDKGRYKEYFFGKIGFVEYCSSGKSGATAEAHVSVRWKEPVKYFEGYTAQSHFRASYFMILSESNEIQN